MKNNIKYFVVLFVLLIFGISCAYAANETSDSTVSDETVTAQPSEVNKVITKTNTKDKAVKTGYDEVTSYNQLADELTEKTTEKTVYLKKGTYKATKTINLWDSPTLKKVEIFGNGAVIDGSNSKQFLKIFKNVKVTVHDLTIKNTKGGERSGAIDINAKGMLVADNCTFINAVSTGKGGAITDSGSSTIQNCKFIGCTSGHGGAIWSTGENGGTFKLENSVFTKNKASVKNNNDRTAVVYYLHLKNVKISNNVFDSNIGRPLHSFKSVSDVTGNTVKNIVLNAPKDTIRGAVIDNYEANINIINNEFNNIKISAKSVKGGLLYNEIGTSSFEDNKITGLKISSTERTDSLNGGILFNRHSTLTVAYNTISNTNNGYKVHGGSLYNNGGKLSVFTNTFKTTNTASNEIRGGAMYNDPSGTLVQGGNDFSGIKNIGKENKREIYGSSSVKTAPKKSTKITLNKVTGVVGDTVNIEATVKDNRGIGVTSGNLAFNVNGKKTTIKTNKDGVFTYKYKTTKVGSNTVTATFAANNKYTASSAKKTFTITKKTSKLTVTKVANKIYNDKVTITGKLVDNSGAVIKNANVKVKFNTQTVTVKTNTKGVYTTKVTANKVGKNNVTVAFAGNTNTKASSVKTTFYVGKKATKVTLNKIADVTVGDEVTVTGKLTDVSGVVIKNANLRVRISGQLQNVKTNSNGIFTAKATTKKVGTNKIAVLYEATTNYKLSSLESTFNVVKATD
ncbi:MAG: Ig-like domain repeat protein [Methanosphaera sp.]|nr:Ig-like domain repeat protein [Methanosphaera sp.]